jgi:hypothetical protein
MDTAQLAANAGPAFIDHSKSPKILHFINQL